MRALRQTVIGCIALGATGLWPETAAAQEGGIEVFSAETIFDQGTRLSLSHIYKRKGTLFEGTDEVSDPLDRVFEEYRLVAQIDGVSGIEGAAGHEGLPDFEGATIGGCKK